MFKNTPCTDAQKAEIGRVAEKRRESDAATDFTTGPTGPTFDKTRAHLNTENICSGPFRVEYKLLEVDVQGGKVVTTPKIDDSCTLDRTKDAELIRKIRPEAEEQCGDGDLADPARLKEAIEKALRR